MTDKEIIALFWARNETAITATSDKYGGYCYTVSFNILYSAEDAEECVNDTYLGAWNAMPPHSPSRLSTYLGKITRNLSINRYNQYHAEKRGKGQADIVLSELNDCVPSATNVEEIVDEMALVDALNQFLHSLPKKKRIIFICRYWYLDPIKEIAKNIGMSESHVASILFRIRKDLKTHLEKEGIVL